MSRLQVLACSLPHVISVNILACSLYRLKLLLHRLVHRSLVAHFFEVAILTGVVLDGVPLIRGRLLSYLVLPAHRPSDARLVPLSVVAYHSYSFDAASMHVGKWLLVDRH